MTLKAMTNNSKHKLVADKLATGHDRFCLLAELGTSKNFGAQQIAS
jgi:hypothetical protein